MFLVYGIVTEIKDVILAFLDFLSSFITRPCSLDMQKVKTITFYPSFIILLFKKIKKYYFNTHNKNTLNQKHSKL